MKNSSLKALFICCLLVATAQVNAINKSSYKLSSKRVKNKIDLIRNNVSFRFRYFYGAKVVNKDELNAWNIGTHIVVTRALLKKLDDRELLAVVAHEMGHRERFHLLSRVGMYIGGSIVALFDLESSQGYTDRVAEFNEYYRLQQELQADCYAYNWLAELRDKGFKVDPTDLNKATEAITGIDFSHSDNHFDRDLPIYIRYREIQRGHSSYCD